jgi:predicted nucleotidyltransferase
VQILDSLSCVDVISFGSETSDIEKLLEVSKLMSHETEDFKESIKASLDKGNSFPKARAEAIKKTAGDDAAAIVSSPNNILAVEYLRELIIRNSNIVPITIQRRGPDDNSTVLANDFASATGIRNNLKEYHDINKIQEYVPDLCFQNMKNLDIDIKKKSENIFMLLCAKILSENEKSLEAVFSAGEGLGNKLKKAVRESKDLEDLISGVKSKRYTRTRIQRLLTHTLLAFKGPEFQNMLHNKLNYTRVLAFNDNGKALLKRMKKREPKIPVVTNINKQINLSDDVNQLLRYDILATDMYNLISGYDIEKNSDFVTVPHYMKIS